MSQYEYYERIGKRNLLLEPSKYAWNCVLFYIQFTQEEILSLREWLPIRELVMYQQCLTRSFLHQYFQEIIDDSFDIGWSDVELYVKEE